MTPPRRAFGTDPPGRLPAAMVRVLAAELSDPGRFRRARQYAADGAVVDIAVEPGEVRAEVRGSRFDPYIVALRAALVSDGATVAMLVPQRDELVATCSCPDGAVIGVVCKHALAALLVLADELTIEPALLARWRSARMQPGEWPGARDAAEPDDEGEPVDLLAGVTTGPRPLPAIATIPSRLPVPIHGDDALADAVLDALAALRRLR